MYNVQDAYSPWASLYFLTLTIFGSFFLLNMVLAVIWDKFSQFQEAGRWIWWTEQDER